MSESGKWLFHVFFENLTENHSDLRLIMDYPREVCLVEIFTFTYKIILYLKSQNGYDVLGMAWGQESYYFSYYFWPWSAIGRLVFIPLWAQGGQVL